MKIIESEKNEKYLGYRLYIPDNMSGELPLMIYLHGAGERGVRRAQLEHMERNGVPRIIKEGREIDAIVLCPQCPEMFVWNNIVVDLKKLIDNIIEQYRIKKDRICITGSSMGGYGTWEMGMTFPSFFSAIAPVSGGGMEWRAQKLVNTPVRAYHGADDDAVKPINSKMMVDKIQEAGGSAKFCLLQGFGHGDGIYEAYKNQNLIEWILKQRRTNFDIVEEVASSWF